MCDFILYGDDIALLILMAVAVYDDFSTGHISNYLILSGSSVGIGIHVIKSGPGGVAYSLTGFILPFVLLFLLHILKMTGAGDVKLLMMAGTYYRGQQDFDCHRGCLCYSRRCFSYSYDKIWYFL